MRLLLITATAVCLSLGVGQAEAQDWARGVAAFNSEDYETAFVELLPLAQQGDADAQWRVGFMYLQGNGVERDGSEALKWFQMSAPSNVVVQQILGGIYQSGEVGPHDYVLSLMWYSIASINGWSPAEGQRDAIATKMNPEEIKTAQAMANTCMTSGYKECGW